jgi:hypothetical protein
MSEAIKKSDIVQGDPFGEIAADITETLAALDKYDKSIKSIANTMQNDLSKAAKKTVQDIEAINKAEVQSEKLMQEKIRTSKMQMDLQAKQNQLNAQAERQAKQQAAALEKEAAQKEKANKQSERAAKLARDEASAYKQLERNTRDLKNQSKELGAQMLKLEQSGKRNTAEYRKLESQYRLVTRAAQAGDVQLKKLDKTVGDNFRNVGNYKDALTGLNGVLGTIGVAFGVTEVVGGIFNINKELDKATNTARMFFGESEEGTKKLAQEAVTLGKVWGKDTNDVLSAANVLTKEFGISGEEALQRINTGFNKGADVQGEFIENIKEYSSQLSYAGLNAEQTIALITQSQEQGVFSDKGVDSIKEAALSLREMTDPAKEALAAIGMSGEELQVQIQSGQLTYFEAIQKISAKTAEFGQGSQEAGMILADVFKGAGEDAGRFIFSLDKMNLNLDEMDNTSQGLDSALGNLTEKFYEFIFGVNEASGAGAKFAYAIQFLADNLSTILNTVAKAVVAWGAYLAISKSIQAYNFLMTGGLKTVASRMMDVFKAGKQAGEGAKVAGEGIKSTGRALGAVPWVAIIGLVVELATAFYDVASGAAEARRQQELTDKYSANAKEKADKRVTERSNNLQKEIAALQDLRNENKLTEDEFLKRKEQTIKQTKAQVKEDIKAVNARKAGYKADLAALEESEKLYQAGGRGALTEEQLAFRSQFLAGEGVTGKMQSLRASISASNKKLAEYNKELSDVGETTKRATSEVAAYDAQQARSGNITKANTASVKEYKTEFKDLNEYISEQADLLQKLKEIQQERTLEGQQQNIDDMLANQVKAARETGEAQVDQLEATIAAMFQLEKDYIEQKRDFQLQQLEADYQLNKAKRLQELNDEKSDLIAAADGNADAIAKINTNYDAKKKQLDADEALRYEDLQLQKTLVTEEATDEVTDLKQQEHDEINRVNDAIIEGQKEFADTMNSVNKEGSDKDVDTIKERYELIQGIQQAATDALKEQIDKRIDLLQQEADAAKTQQDFLQNLAANGNIYAQQSIAEQIRIQREAQQEQLRLERQKQSIELISAGLKTFEASLSEGKTPAEALAATVVSTQVLTGFLKNLQFYEKGTMNAPGGLSVVDEKGAELITDRQGNIKEMGAGKGPRFTMLSPGDKVYTATQTSSLLSAFDNVGNMSKLPKSLNASGGFETATITRELKALQQIVSNKSESNVHWESFSSGIAEIVQHKNVGGRKITNRFRVK